jgi:tRNA-specific 2-thiouridylase
MSGKRVVVAMSGGVDSSVAAALLVRAGYQVEGVMLKLWSESPGPPSDPVANRCCTPDQVADARAVAEILGIPFHTWDVVDLFRETVVDDFIAAYSAGLTPNPCLVCNRQIRFGYLLERVTEMGADYLATGHYVRLDRDGGEARLLRGVDAAKDQSYVLHMLQQSQLRQLLFPVGDYAKTEIRGLARELDLPVAAKADSQDICFLSDGDYRRFLRQHAPEAMRPGPILDRTGTRLGTHQGLAAYTIGQRRGLNVTAPQPLYVLEIDPSRNVLVVGTKGEVGQRELTTRGTHWVSGNPPDGERPFPAEVRIRYKSTPRPATITPGAEGEATVRFRDPLSDITPGQAAVFYHGEVCLGGGTITREGNIAHTGSITQEEPVQ